MEKKTKACYTPALVKWIGEVTSSTYEVIVDNNRSPGEMIKAGDYDLVDKSIEEKCFSLKGKGKERVEIVLFHFDYRVSAEEVIAEMRMKGFRPANAAELLALGEAYPDLQREAAIIAPGPGWHFPGRYRVVSRLDTAGSFGYGRGLYLDWFDKFDYKKWGGGTHCYLFAAVR